MLGFLKRAIESSSHKKTLRQSIEAYERQQAAYLTMTKEELALLPEDALFSAAFARIFHIVDSFEDPAAGIRSLSVPAKAFYVTVQYEAEVYNGGLCQFFSNSSRLVAPELSACLAEIGADAHKKLYDAFLLANGIDVHDLSSFDAENVSEYLAQEQRYDFSTFNQRFNEMKPVQEYLTPYIKAHIQDF